MRNDCRVAAIAGAVVVTVLNAQGLCAQSSAGDAGSPAFEVASIKPNQSGDGVSSLRFAPGGRFIATNTSLRDLIRLSYGTPPQLLPASQIIGGPNWMGADRFDIMARAEASSGVESGRPSPELLLMVRALVADRFKLAIHNEVRELPVYSLVIARRDGRLGPQLRRSEVDCAALRVARGSTAALPPGPPPPPGLRRPTRMRPMCGSNGSPGWMAGGGMPISDLTIGLSREVKRVVRDQTGLTGEFDYQLEWTPDEQPPPLPPDSASQRPDVPPPPPPAPVDGPSIFTAVQEQLGLKLESTRGPVDVLVIDRAERPTED